MTEQLREEARPVQPATGVRRSWRGLAIAGVIAIAGTLALAALNRPAGPESQYAVVEQPQATAAAAPDPLMTELIRCRALPPQVDDPACRAAWETNRRRFFGERRATRVPGDPLPTSAPIPMPGYAAIPAPGAAPTVTER